jgi:hypothetical protein
VHLSAIEAIEADIGKYRERIRAKAEALETITDPKDLNLGLLKMQYDAAVSSLAICEQDLRDQTRTFQCYRVPLNALCPPCDIR